MVFGGTHPPQVTSELMKLTQFHKGDSIFKAALLKHSPVFCCTFIYFLSNCSSLTFQYLTKGTLRSADFGQFSSVCTAHSAHSAHERTFRGAYLSFRATTHLGTIFRKHFFFCSGSICLFFAGGECQSCCSMYFVFSIFFDLPLVTQKHCSDKSDDRHP